MCFGCNWEVNFAYNSSRLSVEMSVKSIFVNSFFRVEYVPPRRSACPYPFLSLPDLGLITCRNFLITHSFGKSHKNTLLPAHIQREKHIQNSLFNTL